MALHNRRLADGLFTVAILGATFLINQLLEGLLQTGGLTAMLFVLGVFLVAYRTQGYFYGIAASLLSALIFNYAFTYPFYAIDLVQVESLATAAVLLLVACMTSALTTKIKQQEKLRAQSEREAMRAGLLRAISHDLRTPLTSIYGSTAAVIENYDSLSREQQLQLLGEVRADADWLIRMVENLLSVTRVGGGRVQLIKAPTVLEELIDAVLVKFQKRCPGQAVQVQIPEDFISIPMDAMLIEQVLLNLLENAVRHAQGMRNLWLRVTVQGAQACFTVQDDGCGIAPQRLADLFTGSRDPAREPADSSRSNMGIGLSVCAAIIRAHGGEIRAENAPGGGAVFRFSLQLEDADERKSL